MTLGYSQQFPWGEPTNFQEKILVGAAPERVLGPSFFPKLHSMREDAKDRWKPGMAIHHVYGSRTKNRECFLENKCISTQRVQIRHSKVTGKDSMGNDVVVGNSRIILIDGRVMSDETVKQLAINDGFDSVEDFFRWFGENWNGKIIHWTKLRY
jgi:hypothetical protein